MKIKTQINLVYIGDLGSSKITEMKRRVTVGQKWHDDLASEICGD